MLLEIFLNIMFFLGPTSSNYATLSFLQATKACSLYQVLDTDPSKTESLPIRIPHDLTPQLCVSLFRGVY